MRLTLPSLLTTSLLLTACGSGDSAIDSVRDIPNRFGSTQNALDDFSSGSTGDSSNTRGLKPNQARLTMELPGLLAPEGEATRRNLRIVIPDELRVYHTNTSQQKFEDVSYSTEKGADGHFILTFDDGIPVGPDVVIEARYGNHIMTALASDADRDIKVNPFSHYLVTEILWRYYSKTDYQTVLACVDNPTCINKYVWGTLADQVHDFEIDIPENASIDQATGTLATRADFARYVENMANYALLGQASSDRIRASAADYNSVFFALELGQTFRESRIAGAGQWGTRIAREEKLTSDNSAFLYPALTLTSFDAFGLNITSLATGIPYDRETLIHGFHDTSGSGVPEQAFYSRGAEHWERNSHSSAPGAATLTTAPPARLMAGRALYQSITNRNSNEINGWTRNPYYLNAFTSEPADEQSGPDRVLSNYFTAGKSIALADEGGKLKRQKTLEDHYLSVFELHLQRSKAFDSSAIENGEYNLAYFSAKLNSDAAPTFGAGFGSWTTGNAPALESWALSRDNSLQPTLTPGPAPGVWQLSNRRSNLSYGTDYIGRLNLFQSNEGPAYGQPDLGVGASTPDSSLLAFNLDTASFGTGIAIATRKTSNDLPQDARYRVQGLVTGLSGPANTLYQIDNGTLTISNGTATLMAGTPTANDGSVFAVQHRIMDNTVNTPENTLWNISFSFTASSGLIEDNDGGGPDINGIYSNNGDQLFLTIQQDSGTELRTGLLMATRLPED